MPFAESADNRFVRLGVVVHFEGWIFVVQSMQPELQLLFVAARRRFHGEVYERFGELDRFETNRMFLRGQCVVGVRVAQLGDAAYVARV